MTEYIRVAGSGPLIGSVDTPGAKNSVLPLLAATLLAPGTTTLTGVPAISDVHTMGAILEALGAQVDYDSEAQRVTVAVSEDGVTEAPYDLVRRIRGSFTVLGPLCARLGEARIPLPGGDRIGSRAVDLHMDGLSRMGAEVAIEHGYVVARASRLKGAQLWLDIPSVGATENLIMAAALAKGTTVIDNAAREPEVVDLCQLLQSMGAHIHGAGTSTVTIDGVEHLSPTEHRIIPDRIVAGTYAYAAALTQGDVTVRGARPEHLEVALEKLVSAGATVDVDPGGFRVRMTKRPRAVDVSTLPYPGFPTDLQPLAIILLAVSEGAAMVTENLYDGRFTFVDELARLGADVRIDGHHCLVHGTPRLSGAPVRASDVRAGAGLVLAGLVADGPTEVHEIHHVDRGYPGFCEALSSLGAEVSRESYDRRKT